jgi:hypothetical protein
LGWVSVPNLEIRNLYGPGKHLQTNSQGFRKTEEIGPEEPSGKARVICSGDSFTLGYGVSNGHTWCDLLEQLDVHLQSVNMGQGGYGVDQAYLWFRRDAADLAHSVHVLAFVTEDFRRMAASDLTGYAKPKLIVTPKGLELRNVPVPESSSLAGARREDVRNRIRQLRVIELGRLALRKLGFDASVGQDSSREGLSAEATAGVFHVLLDSLVAVNQQKESSLILVHLPQEHELLAPEPPVEYVFWQERLSAEATARGIIYIDLVSELRELPGHRIRAMFIQKTIGNLYGSAGHYTEEGNARVAAHIHARLNKLPALSAKRESLNGADGADK